jgi:adenylate cyclase
MTGLYEMFVAEPDLRQRMLDAIETTGSTIADKRQLKQILELYAGPPSQYINYYGPARSIRTIPFYKVLESDESLAALQDKLVFVGFSEHRQWEQQDGFYSVYSNEEGLDISGVEITAAATANLLEGVSIKPMTLGQHFLVLLLVSVVLVLIYHRTRGAWLPITLLIAAAVYFLLAWQLFSYNGLWLPLVVPLLIQLPVVLLLGMTWNYQELNRERKNIQRAFGYYLPETEVNRLARDITTHNLGGQLMHGTCLSSDAQQYTTLSETMTPQQLTTFMNAYYESIFRPVRQYAGIISDVVGDSVMALWASPAENLQQREQAIKAAIRIVDSVAAFNQQHPGNQLPTRIGLHYGVMVIGNVGAVDHYEYRAVGDIVNTTSRIEGLCKYLGIRLLASADVLEGLQGFDSRFVGRFILKGKTVGLPLYEIGAQNIANHSTRTTLWQQFSDALNLFQQGQWAEACEAFAQILEIHADDGPSSFYRHYCEKHQCIPPENWQGVIHMQDK